MLGQCAWLIESTYFTNFNGTDGAAYVQPVSGAISWDGYQNFSEGQIALTTHNLCSVTETPLHILESLMKPAHDKIEITRGFLS